MATKRFAPKAGEFSDATYYNTGYRKKVGGGMYTRMLRVPKTGFKVTSRKKKSSGGSGG